MFLLPNIWFEGHPIAFKFELGSLWNNILTILWAFFADIRKKYLMFAIRVLWVILPILDEKKNVYDSVIFFLKTKHKHVYLGTLHTLQGHVNLCINASKLICRGTYFCKLKSLCVGSVGNERLENNYADVWTLQTRLVNL